jgi:hypothetical protein
MPPYVFGGHPASARKACLMDSLPGPRSHEPDLNEHAVAIMLNGLIAKAFYLLKSRSR